MTPPTPHTNSSPPFRLAEGTGASGPPQPDYSTASSPRPSDSSTLRDRSDHLCYPWFMHYCTIALYSYLLYSYLYSRTTQTHSHIYIYIPALQIPHSHFTGLQLYVACCCCCCCCFFVIIVALCCTLCSWETLFHFTVYCVYGWNDNKLSWILNLE